MRYDGINAHVKRKHPDVEITKGFTRNLPNNGVRASLVTPTKTEGLYADPQSAYINPIITLNGESCSYKNYKIVSLLIDNGINIEKVKENLNLLKSIDNFQ